MIAGLNIGLGNGLSLGLFFGQSVGLISGIFFGLSYWMIIGLTAGLRMIDAPIKKTTQPQDRMKEGLLGSLLLFIILVLICIILFFKVIYLPEISSHTDAHLLFNMQFFCMLIFVISMPIFLSLNIYNIFQYYMLRLCLRWEGQLPLVPWLEAMQQRKVLQRVGGSYHFLHKQLQEYLAKR